MPDKSILECVLASILEHFAASILVHFVASILTITNSHFRQSNHYDHRLFTCLQITKNIPLCQCSPVSCFNVKMFPCFNVFPFVNFHLFKSPAVFNLHLFSIFTCFPTAKTLPFPSVSTPTSFSIPCTSLLAKMIMIMNMKWELSIVHGLMMMMPVVIEGDRSKLVARTRNHHPALNSRQP